MKSYTIRLWNPKSGQHSYHVYYNTNEADALAMAKADHPVCYFNGIWPYVLDICKVK